MSLKGKQPQTKKKWPRYCFYAAIAMVVLAIILYVIYCQSINSEFGSEKKYFEESFDELYSLATIDDDITDPIVAMGDKALHTIGTGEEFGLLSRYCIEPEYYPDAVRVEAEIDTVTGAVEKTGGYLWIAYHQEAYDADGELVTASGTEDRRILARWSLELIDGAWTVTAIDEAP